MTPDEAAPSLAFTFPLRRCWAGGAIFVFSADLLRRWVVFLYDSGHQKNGEPPPHFVAWLLIGLGCFFFLLGLIFAACIVLSGRSIGRHRRDWFTFVLACVECLFVRFGVVLGVFTIIVLSRRSVKELYGIETGIPSSP